MRVLLLSLGCFLVLMPVVWTILTSLKTAEQTLAIPPVWFFTPQWSNYAEVLRIVPLQNYALNTAIIVTGVVVGTLLSCSFSAYGFTDPKVVEALRFVQDLMWTKHIAPRPDERDANNSAGGFAGGVVSMMPGGTWGIASYQQMKDGWGIAPLPLYQGQSVMRYWLGGWVIPKASAALTAAQTFAIWRATTFQEQMAADHDWIPIQDAARTSETMLKGMPDGFEAAMQSLPSARIGDLYTENSQKILNEVYSTHLDELFRNKATPEAVAQAIQDEATALL